MKKYDLILLALYVLLLLLVWGGLVSLGSQINASRKEVVSLCEHIDRTKINSVVIKNTELRIRIDRDEEWRRIAIKGGRLPTDGIKIFRLSRDTLYITGNIGRKWNFLTLGVPDSVRVDIEEAPNVYYKE